MLSPEAHIIQKKRIKERVLKRIFDLVISLAILVLLLPFILIIILLLKLEGIINPSLKGPVFYREMRVSKGKKFQMYKFRTVKSEFLEVANKEKCSITDFTASPDKSKYLTPTGKMLVLIYFDELPQLFNVLKDDLSLVGPRPHIPCQYEEDLKNGIVSAKYIKAGIMGMVQALKGNPALAKTFAHMALRHSTSDKSMVFIDRLYFQKYLKASALEMLLYDMGILLRCLRVVLEAKGI
ncbi:MAG: sugar transferase [Candidatus Omnitrophica bacterium]|nr:sugar transferase [Candidatus Omnitrophota bacterium]